LRELLDGEREDPSIRGKLLAALGRCADDDSIAELQSLADAGDVDAEAHLLGALIRRGVEGRLRTSLEDQIKERHPFKYVQIGIEAEDPDAMMVLRAYATADPESAGRLMDILARRGDDAAISELRLWPMWASVRRRKFWPGSSRQVAMKMRSEARCGRKFTACRESALPDLRCGKS
jgi:hypothetical protein